jgi:hypothetical protein
VRRGGRTQRFTAVVRCSCQILGEVPYTHTWDDPMIRRIAIAKAGWSVDRETGVYRCPKCVAARGE